ncbi:MAG: tryptophan--tRNA ligase [Candidatus Micrarchaeota archaeon]|nr:tryptophan--tRNA ligase [Candidatus Micrarchaeota archaeon]
MEKGPNESEKYIIDTLENETERLIQQFGASRISDLREVPEFKAFKNGLLYSHRDFDKFYNKLRSGQKSAIVSGLNPSGTLHIGHIGIFDTILHFQKSHDTETFIPISDDESYVAKKVETQEEALKNALMLTRSMIAYGFEPKKTKVVIDQIYTNIYNFAIKLSKGVNLSTINAVYDYKTSESVGLHFYPSVQAAHVLFPQTLGIKNVLVPIGPDEDAHLRVCRDVAAKYGYEAPAVVHNKYLPGIEGSKMSKSKNNAIFLLEEKSSIKKKTMNAFSGGRTSIEEHRKLGGIPENDVAYIYLKYYFLEEIESENLYHKYKKGELLSGDMKNLLLEKIMDRVEKLRAAYEKVKPKDIDKMLMKNEDVDVVSIVEKMGIC